ncbi:MAG: hypothetical protein OXU69_00130 [Gemmatimonadota bacterium]|nr:hypothetical protein [Gammaproteobacteria bacterium]MDE2983086.1 hypothetical protein [Gemmatimonadota bacterium]
MSVPGRVLSDEVSGSIRGRRVLAAVFTTYTFDPAFFELEILPLLFESRIRGGFSHIEKVRRVQLEECLRDTAEIEVFYDRSGLVGNAGPASLDFRRIDVGRKTGVFHPKLVLVLVENPPTDGGEPTRSLIVATLSANLTRSGWWENVEAGHIEVVDSESPKNRRCTFRQDLLETLSLVSDAARPGERHGALETIRRFVREKAPRGDTRNASWRGRYYTRLFAGQVPLSEWLRARRLAGRNWNLEVVSPFFDAHGPRALERLIRTMRPREVRVLLPTEADGTPCVTGEQYEAIAVLARWSRLPPAVTGSSGGASTERAVSRRVHAKLYRFWRRGEGDVSLVGSPNATGAAHSRDNAGNLEAAFLANTGGGGSERAGWLLQPLDDPPRRFPEEPSSEEGDAERVGLALSLRYDWERQAFEYRLDEEQGFEGEVRIRELSGREVHAIDYPGRGEWRDCGTGAAGRVKELLASTSLVEARIRTPAGTCRWRVLIREEGMTHKPSLLTQLTPDEILRYWSLLSESQRQAFLADRLETDEAILALDPNREPRPPERIPTVFDRFAGVFHAFERLGSWVDEKLRQDRKAEVTARLFGEKYDSLPVLLRKIPDREDRDEIIAYVTFLSAKQAVRRIRERWSAYWSERGKDTRRLECELEKIAGIRERLPLPDPDREEFLTWYEGAFMTVAPELQGGDDRIR